jgi:hypothetical protein
MNPPRFSWIKAKRRHDQCKHINLRTETQAEALVMANSRHAAREIAKELAKFFVEQRWITQDQANKFFWDR